MATEQENQENNKKRLLVALAILLGYASSKEDYEELSPAVKREITREYKNRGLEHVAANPERLAERDVQIQMATQGQHDVVQKYEIAGVHDEHTCEECKKWQGRVVTMGKNSEGLPTVQDFINEHGFHYGCRCSLQEIPDVPRAGLRADGTPYSHNTVFSGYVGELVFN